MGIVDSELPNRIGRELPVVKPLYECRFSLEFPSIKEHLFTVMACNSAKNFYKGSLCLPQREPTRRGYAKKFRFGAYFEHHAHRATKPPNQELSGFSKAINGGRRFFCYRFSNQILLGRNIHQFAHRHLSRRSSAPSPDHDPGEPVAAFEAVPVNSLERRVAAGLSQDDPEVTGTAGAVAE